MRSYDLTELEEMSALSRRTISDYISRGLLAGPSHRGRGARYSQRDLDALRVIPRLRTVLKPEFPNLNSVREFLDGLTSSDLRHLVRLTNERMFEIEIRRIRILHRLKTFLPAVPPETISASVAKLTPEQISGVDRGQIQVGTLLDIESMSGARVAINGGLEPDERRRPAANGPQAARRRPLRTFWQFDGAGPHRKRSAGQREIFAIAVGHDSQLRGTDRDFIEDVRLTGRHDRHAALTGIQGNRRRRFARHGE